MSDDSGRQTEAENMAKWLDLLGDQYCMTHALAAAQMLRDLTAENDRLYQELCRLHAAPNDAAVAKKIETLRLLADERARKYGDPSIRESIRAGDMHTEIADLLEAQAREIKRLSPNEMEISETWHTIDSAEWDKDLLLAWPSGDGWKMTVDWAGKRNSCPPESGVSNGWQHGNATHWRHLPKAPTHV